MAAKILYTKKGSDAAMITWPASGPPAERWTFTAGTALAIPDLIGYGDGSATYPDGRLFPSATTAGSSFAHQKS